ncbi:MAG: outer membrane protein [Beijerinckiaceae bacterium]
MKSSLRLLAAAGVSLLAVATASAADLPSRKFAPVAPVAYAPAFSWTGFYAGLQGGYQWGSTSGAWNTIPPGAATPYSYDPTGWMIGGHLGYNYQINQIVVGLEGDVEWADLKATRASAVPLFYHTTSIDWQASLRARLGVAVDRALIYVTGGLAYADVGYSLGGAVGTPPVLSYSKDKWGWTAGAGVEYAFTNNITGRVEYRYTDFGSVSGVSIANAVTDSAKLNSHAVRVGLSYKF